MDEATTVVWLAPAPADAEQARALTSWQRARGVTLDSPRDAKVVALAVDAEAASEVERQLDRARDGLAARDGEAVDRALGAAEAALRAAPQLPQAAWLMAEVLRARAARLRRVPPLDDAAAAQAGLRAAALDRGRVPGVGEHVERAAPAAATLALDAIPAGAAAWLDGARVTGTTVETGAGPHALVVTWDGAPVWARWIEAAAGTSTVRVDPAVAPACSRADVLRARLDGDEVRAEGVRCEAWVAAAPVAPPGSGVRLALCEGARCGAMLPWLAPAPWTVAPPVTPPARGGWPAWATWTVVGAGAVVAGVVAVVAAGALGAAPGETRFVSGGVKTQ